MGFQVRGVKALLATGVAAIAGALLAACDLNVQPSSITVEARLQGRTGTGVPVPDQVLTLSHRAEGNTDPRLVYRRGTVPDLDAVVARAPQDAGVPFTETWHVLSLSHIAQRPGSDPTFVEFTGDPGWVKDHAGDLAWVTLRHRETTIPEQRFMNFAVPGLRPAGGTILARVEDDDPVLLWRDTDGCGAASVQPLLLTLRNLAPAGGVDCFDMESLASTMLTQLAVAITDVAHDRDAAARRHRLLIVPHVPTVAAGNTPAAPGFGFIYQADLEPTSNGSGIGGFTGTLQLSIPITLHWVRGADGRVTLLMDPIGASVGGTPTNNIARVTVSAVENSIAAGSAGSLRTAVSAALTTTPLPTGPGGIAFPAFINLFFAEGVGLGGTNTVPADFSVLARPSNQAVPGAPPNVALTLGEITVTDVPGLPANGAGLGGRAQVSLVAGRVRVQVNRNAAGTTRRFLDVPAPVETLPFDFVLLR
jgi:hypothetical protein